MDEFNPAVVSAALARLAEIEAGLSAPTFDFGAELAKVEEVKS